jgi:SHS2 domain-containing protein
MVNPNGIDVVVRKDLTIRAENLEDLLFNWLSELVYVKDVEHLIFSEFDITIVEDKGGLLLTATLGGEEIDPRRHELGQDVKAVTYHLFEIKKVNGRYEARVVLDI